MTQINRTRVHAMRLVAMLAQVVIVAVPAVAQRAALTDTQVREQIVHDSVARYLATGHPCACPYNTMRNGRQCGNVSAYIRPGGASPLCYPKDVSDAMVAEWRRAHP